MKWPRRAWPEFEEKKLAMCNTTPDLSPVTRVQLDPDLPLVDYRAAMGLADREARARLGDCMLLSWYDRDRDYESPPNTTECPGDCEKNGYILYAASHGATLKVDIEEGRFVFFFTPVEW